MIRLDFYWTIDDHNRKLIDICERNRDKTFGFFLFWTLIALYNVNLIGEFEVESAYDTAEMIFD